MPRKAAAPPRLTASQLTVMQVLWSRDEASVTDVQRAMTGRRLAPTTASVNTVVVAPMPMASERTAVAVKSGLRTSRRNGVTKVYEDGRRYESGVRPANEFVICDGDMVRVATRFVFQTFL
jgi:hypothetical protein